MYVESLIAWDIFKQVKVEFLPSVNTHEDIYQALSRTKEHLQSHNAIALRDLHRKSRQIYNKQVSLTNIKFVASWSGLYQTKKALQKVSGFPIIATFLSGDRVRMDLQVRHLPRR